MKKSQFKAIRAKLGKTQKEMSQLIGTSIKAVHSYEQGWRKVPHHVERQMLFLLSRAFGGTRGSKQCWEILSCKEETRENCPAWEYNSGDLCWFINGTNCSGMVHKTWRDKIEECKACEVFSQSFKERIGF